MKFSTRTELRVPLEQVFLAVTDMARIERQLLRKGVHLDGPPGNPRPEGGQNWSAHFRYRGKPRVLDATVREILAPQRLVIDSRTGGLENTSEIDLIALAADKTRVRVAIEMRPRSLSARLFLQSLKLVKGRAQDRFSARVKSYLYEIEQSYGS